jgi:hypothetical protein
MIGELIHPAPPPAGSSAETTKTTCSTNIVAGLVWTMIGELIQRLHLPVQVLK